MPTVEQLRREYRARMAAELIAKRERERKKLPGEGGGIPEIILRAFGQIGDVLVQAPFGVYEAAKGVGKDIESFSRALASRVPYVKDWLYEPELRDSGSFVPRNIVQMGKGIGQSVVYDFTHFKERPGYALADLAFLGFGGAGSLSRVGAAGRAGAAAAAAGAGRGALTEAILAFREPPPPLQAAFGRDPRIVQRGGRYSYQLTRPPTTPGFEPITVERILSRSPLASTLQVLANQARQARLAQPERLADQGPVARAISKIVSPEETFRRELRAMQRVRREGLLAPAAAAVQAAGGGLAERMSRTPALSRVAPLSGGEQQAIRVVGVFGDEARRNPEKAVLTMIEAHRGMEEKYLREADELMRRADDLRIRATSAEEREDPGHLLAKADDAEKIALQRRDLAEAQRREMEMLQTAMPSLRALQAGEARPRLAEALTVAEQLSRARSQMLVHKGELGEGVARRRDVAPAAAYEAAARRAREQRVIDRLGQERAAPLVARRRLGEAIEKAGGIEGLHRIGLTFARPDVPGGTYSRPATTQDLGLIEGGMSKSRQRDLERALAIERLRELRDARGRRTGVFEPVGELPRARRKAAAARELLEREKRRLRPLTEAEARRRIDEIERRYGPVSEPRWQGLRKAVEEKIGKARAAGQEPHPTLLRTLAELDERDRLLGGLAQAERIRQGQPEPGSIAAPGRRLTADERRSLLGETEANRAFHLGRYTERARAATQRVKKLEDELERLIGKPVAQLERIEQLPDRPGAFRLSLFEKVPQELLASVPTLRMGPYGKGRPQPDPTLTHDYRAGEIRYGDTTADVLRGQVRDYLGGVKIVTAIEDHMLAGRDRSAIRRSEWDVPWRETQHVHKEFKRRMATRGEHVTYTLEEIREIGAGIDESYVEVMSPRHIDVDGGTISLVDQEGNVLFRPGDPRSDFTRHGIWWVDRRMFGMALDPASEPGRLRAIADAINNPFKGLMIYGRLAYILNLPGNMVMQAITQGWGAPGYFARSGRVASKYGEEYADLIDAAIGEGKARSYAASGRTKAGRISGANIVNAFGTMWSNLVDRYSRRSALLHEMHQHGIDLDDVAEVRDFLKNPGRLQERTLVFRRANKNMVEFNSLTPIERNTLRHLFFVYPWMSRASLWSLRTLVEHPVKAFTLVQLAEMAEKQVEIEIGQLPAQYERRGYFAVRGEDGKLRLVSTAGINSFQTLAEVAEGLADMVRGGDLTYEDFATPLTEIVLRGGRRSLTGKGEGFSGAAREFLAGLPQVAAIKRLGVGAPTEEQVESRPMYRRPVFPEHSVSEAVGPFVAGGLYPRRADEAVLRSRARYEELAEMDKPDRTSRRLEDYRGEWVAVLGKIGAASEGRINYRPLAEALDSHAERQIRYAQYAQEKGIPIAPAETRLLIDLEIAKERGLIRDEHADYVRDIVERGVWSTRQAREWLHTLMGEKIISQFRSYLSTRGIEPPRFP